MGSIKSYIYNPTVHKTILIIGLPDTGKTSTLYQFKFNEKVFTIPTSRYNVESFSYKNKYYTAYDMQYTEDLIKSNDYKELYNNVNIIIYIVDKSDVIRLVSNKNFLFQILNKEELKNKPILIIANKSDLKNGLSTSDLADKLSLYDIKDREWFIREACSFTGEGLKESLDWINKF
jgi:GTPase SAR1 family protein